ncbi:MAG TPA: hypothetical protein DIU37_06665, partial [Opitutae bacterium]|nr:hypothetical protein [Opitutae bacterium]
YLYPLGFFLGEGGFFHEGDASQHVSGWLFFAKDTWRFPWLITERLSYPEGTSLVFTDSIPIAALLFKPFAQWLPEGFHYIGLWHGVAYLTQAAAATFTIRALGGRTVFAALIATAFAMTWPALTKKLGHAALMTHALLIASFGIYYLGIHEKMSSNKAYSLLALLGLLSIGIHAYLWGMMTCMLFAFLIDDARGRRRIQVQFVRCLLYTVGTALCMFVLGYFTAQGSGGGYGGYSLNLLSPMVGGSLNPLPAYFDGMHRASSWEGYHYFGLGFLALLGYLFGIHLIRSGRQFFLRMWVASGPYRGLIFILVGVTLFAISNKIYLGNYGPIYFTLPEWVEKMCNVFRASGRFFWLPSYILLFTTLAYFLKEAKKPYYCSMLALLMLLQWADLSQLRHFVREEAHKPVPQDNALRQMMEEAAFVYVYPPAGCSQWSFFYLFYYRTLQYSAAEAGTMINTGYLARYNWHHCRGKEQRFEGLPQPDTLYVVSREFLEQAFWLPEVFVEAIDRGDCLEDKDGIVVCGERELIKRVRQKVPSLQRFEHLPETPRKIFYAWILPTEIGEYGKDGFLYVKDVEQAGYLSLGPYVDLPKGKYRVEIVYASQSAADVVIGKWDIATDYGRRHISEGLLMGTGGTFENVIHEFALHENVKNVEIRTFYEGMKELALKSIIITRLADEVSI